jgi:hypothetical protein
MAGFGTMNAVYDRLKKSAMLAALLAPALAALPAARGQPPPQSLARKTAKPKIAAAAPVKELPMPFRAGEALSYRVAWAAFSNAASVELTVPERRDLFGWATWHFRAVARTLSPVRALFAVDDQFDSYADSATLESRQYETHLDELGRTQDQVLHFVSTGQTSRAPGPAVVILPGTRDPLGALYALRGVDWQRTPEFRAPVYDGRNLYEIRANRQNAGEAVTVAAGRFTASRIAIRVFQFEKEVPAIHFALWLGNDAARTPVLIQADLPFGSLRAELVSAPH